jgi:hypothetical protein
MKKPAARRTHQTNISPRDLGPLPWSYLIVIAICGCVLGAGFFLAARQHFTSMDLGMKNSRLRKQLEDLESENRRLLLVREVAISPVEITKAARNLGFLETNAAMPAMPIAGTSKATIPVDLKPSNKSKVIETAPNTVTLTAYQRPAKATLIDPVPKREVSEKLTKKAVSIAQKALKPELTAIVKIK